MSVFLNNLDDFIAPNQACVNPLVSDRLKRSAEDAASAASAASTATAAAMPVDSAGAPAVSVVNTKGAKLSLSLDTSTTDFDVALINLPAETRPDLIKSRVSVSGSSAVAVASVSLNDCLACSGCVTSSEAVLIQEQGYEKLRGLLDAAAEIKAQAECTAPSSSSISSRMSVNSGSAESDTDTDTVMPSLFVASISPQTAASFANAISTPGRPCSAAEAFLRLAALFKHMGFTYVFDTSAGGDVALVEMREEFIARHALGRSQEWVAPPVTTAVDSTHAQPYNSSRGSASRASGPSGMQDATPDPLAPVECATPVPRPLPLLTSSCPGWVCYAEKSHPHTLDFISSVKSPQQVIGAVFKRHIAPTMLGLEPTQVYHVSVEPCFDKKLEASRLDFKSAYDGSTEVDLVLASNEVWNCIPAVLSVPVPLSVPSSKDTQQQQAQEQAQRQALSLWDFEPDDPQGRDAIEALFRGASVEGESLVRAGEGGGGGGRGSGGYLEHVSRYAGAKLLGIPTDSDVLLQPLNYVVGRNPDMAEATLTGPDGRTLRFARAYGFRNIQSVVTKMRRGKLDFDFVEVMACPSGCLNGGGQLQVGLLTGVEGGDAAAATGGGGLTVEKLRAGRDRVSRVDTLFHARSSAAPAVGRTKGPEHSPLCQLVYGNDSAGGMGLSPYGEAARALLHTRYHNIPRLEQMAPLAAKW